MSQRKGKKPAVSSVATTSTQDEESGKFFCYQKKRKK